MQDHATLTRGSTPLLLRLWNDCYNMAWMRVHGLRNTTVELEAFTNGYGSLDDANHFMVMWLRNLDRVVRRLSTIAELNELTFIDVGCGTGIQTLYAATRYEFHDFQGFDFEAPLVQEAKRNQAKYLRAGRRCTFFVEDASQVRLPRKRYLLFLANPFGGRVLEQFIHHNLEMLVATGSFIAMVNDHGVEAMVKIPSVNALFRSSTFNCSLLSFGESGDPIEGERR